MDRLGITLHALHHNSLRSSFGPGRSGAALVERLRSSPGKGAALTSNDIGPILKDKQIASKLKSPVETRRPVAERLRSPREMMKSLYYAVATFDLYPQMIDEAADCLDLGGRLPFPQKKCRSWLSSSNAFCKGSICR